MRVMEQSVEERGDGGGVAEEFPPVLDGTIRRDQGRRFLIPAHHELQDYVAVVNENPLLFTAYVGRPHNEGGHISPNMFRGTYSGTTTRTAPPSRRNVSSCSSVQHRVLEAKVSSRTLLRL